MKHFVESNKNLEVSDVDSKTALHCALDTNYKKGVKILLSHANINACDEYGETALYKAVTQQQIAWLLLDHNADANICRKMTKMLHLHHTVQCTAESDIIERLIEMICDFDGRNSDEEASLHIAASENDDFKLLQNFFMQKI